MRRSITYVQILASKTEHVIGRKLFKTEWGHLGKISKKFSREHLIGVLDSFMSGEPGFKLRSVRALEYFVNKIQNDPTFLIEDYGEKVIEIKNSISKHEKESHALLKELINSG